MRYNPGPEGPKTSCDRFVRTLKLTAAFAAVILAVVITLIWRASVPPKVPEGWPQGSIWRWHDANGTESVRGL
jgi:hypothetical protein